MKPVFGHRICPFCGGNVEYAGISSGHIFPDINTGQMYVCRKCGYKGSFIIEVDDLDDLIKIKEALNTNKTENVPAFSYPEKWLWLWKILLTLTVLSFIFGLIIGIYGM